MELLGAVQGADESTDWLTRLALRAPESPETGIGVWQGAIAEDVEQVYPITLSEG